MEKIESFKIDHLNHPAGIYLSRRDGDIYTYDVRICKPYADPLLSNAEMHSLEHLLATVLRNGAHGGEVIYVGPMGCQTGFYVLYRGLEPSEAEQDIVSAFRFIAGYDGEMPGNSKPECGNCLNLSVDLARSAAKTFLERIGK